MYALPNALRKRVALLCALYSCCLVLFMSTASGQKTAPDNSARNSNQNETAQQQSERKSDLEMTAKIRRAIVADKSLSTYGHNVKIITRNGSVTLTGPVHSEEEKQAIVAKATAVAGPNKVGDQLLVKK